MVKINKAQRAQAVAEYQRGSMTQQAFCLDFEIRTGIRLAPRTLRSWMASKSSAPLELPPDLRPRLVLVLKDLRDLQDEIEAVLTLADPHEPSPTTNADPAAETLLEAVPRAAVAEATTPTTINLTTTPAAATGLPGREATRMAPKRPTNGYFWDLE